MRKKISTPSKKIVNTHVSLSPFIDEKGMRFLVYCACPFHRGVLKSPSNFYKQHCKEGVCQNYHKIPIENSKDYSIESLEKIFESASKKSFPNGQDVIRVKPFSDEEGRLFYWVQDRGERIHILREGMLERFGEYGLNPEQDLERDHFRLYLQR